MSSLGGELLPGLPNDVSLAHIASKLPWTAFHVLSSVSITWQRTIQGREVFSERIRRQSTETLVIVKHSDVKPVEDRDRNSISLYSMRENAFYKLPPIPQFENGISRYSQFISMHGKLYVLGANSQRQFTLNSRGDVQYDNWPRNNWFVEESNEAYVMDLAGQRQWQRCTSVPGPEPGYEFQIGCGYIWMGQHFVCGGGADYFKSFWHQCDAIDSEWKLEERQWRPVNPFQATFVNGVVSRFTVQGKNYKVTMGSAGQHHEIYVFDSNSASFTYQHSVSWSDMTAEIVAALRPRQGPLKIYPFFILPVNNELLALVAWIRFYSDQCPRNRNNRCVNYPFGRCRCYDSGYCLLQTKGFGTQSKEIAWQKAPHGSWHFDPDYSFAICPIQL